MKIYKIIVFLLFITWTNLIYGGTNESSATSTASATLQKTIDIESTPMNFHKILIKSGDSGNAILSSKDGSLKSDTNKDWIFVEGPANNTGTTGLLKITGEPNSSINITFSTNPLNSGDDTIILRDIESNDLINNSITLDSQGKATINTGGKIQIKSGQNKGQYSGTYNATITY